MWCATSISFGTTNCGDLDTGGKVGDHAVSVQGGGLWHPVKAVETMTICLLR
jgi:hypothetical protein